MGACAVMLVAGAVAVRTQERPSPATTRLPHGAYAVVAEVRARPGKESELRS